VTWVNLGGRFKVRSADGINFQGIATPPTSTLAACVSLWRLILFCISRRIQVVYVDDWLFFRNHPLRSLAGTIGIRVVGMKLALDERDPSVDFRIATGELSPKSEGYGRLVKTIRLSERFSNLIILTSKAYEQQYVSDGFSQQKVIGSFRGIDTSIFNPGADGNEIRSRLNLGGKFVIGWFGLMHSFRLIREVLAPMIHEAASTMPDAHFLIGGEGPLFTEFQNLSNSKDLPLTVLGFVPYSELPKYLMACDVLLCPVSTDFRHTRNSAWLKIPEALAVGRPVIATRTNVSDLDYKDMKAVLWVKPSLTGFKGGLQELRENYPRYLSQAQEQARNFDEYEVSNTIGKIVDRIELLAGRPS